MKRLLRLIAIPLLLFIAMPAMAQIETSEIDTNNAKVVVENGKKVLVLDTGRKARTNFNNVSSGNIELYYDAALWKILDSLVVAPWGGNAVRVKDKRGNNVDIQKAMINEEIGVFFLSGGNLVAITKKDLAKMKDE